MSIQARQTVNLRNTLEFTRDTRICLRSVLAVCQENPEPASLVAEHPGVPRSHLYRGHGRLCVSQRNKANTERVAKGGLHEEADRNDRRRFVVIGRNCDRNAGTTRSTGASLSRPRSKRSRANLNRSLPKANPNRVNKQNLVNSRKKNARWTIRVAFSRNSKGNLRTNKSASNMSTKSKQTSNKNTPSKSNKNRLQSTVEAPKTKITTNKIIRMRHRAEDRDP